MYSSVSNPYCSGLHIPKYLYATGLKPFLSPLVVGLSWGGGGESGWPLWALCFGGPRGVGWNRRSMELGRAEALHPATHYPPTLSHRCNLFGFRACGIGAGVELRMGWFAPDPIPCSGQLCLVVIKYFFIDSIAYRHFAERAWNHQIPFENCINEYKMYQSCITLSSSGVLSCQGRLAVEVVGLSMLTVQIFLQTFVHLNTLFRSFPALFSAAIVSASFVLCPFPA